MIKNLILQTNQIMVSESIRTPRMQGPLTNTIARIPIYKDEYKHLVKNDINWYFKKSQIDRNYYVMNNVHSAIHELTLGEYNIINTVIVNNNKYKFLIDAQESEQERYEQLLKILTSDKFPQYYNNSIKELLYHYFDTKGKFVQYFERLNALFNKLPKSISDNKYIQQSFNSINAMNYNINNNKSVYSDIYGLFFNNFFPLIFYCENEPNDVIDICGNVKQTIANYKLSEIYEQYCSNFDTYINDIYNFLVNHNHYLKALLEQNKCNESQHQSIDEYKEYLEKLYDVFILEHIYKSIIDLQQKCKNIITGYENYTIGNIMNPVGFIL